MFVKNFSDISRAHIPKIKMCFNVKSATYYFHMKMKILADFQICISVPLKHNFISYMRATLSNFKRIQL